MVHSYFITTLDAFYGTYLHTCYSTHAVNDRLGFGIFLARRLDISCLCHTVRVSRKNMPKNKIKENPWNWLIIAVPATIWQILNIKYVQWPVMEGKWSIRNFSDEILLNHNKGTYFWRVLAIWNHCASPAQRPTGRYTLNLCISPHDLATLTPKCVWRTSAQTWFPVWYIFCPSKLLTRARCVPKGQLYSEWIYEVIVSPKMQTWNCKDFCPTKQTRFVAKKTAYTHKKITKKKAMILVCMIGQKFL